GRRGVVVAGAGAGPPERVLALASRLGWPVLADPRSGCRTDHACVVAAADALLRSDEVAAALRPEVVLMLGAPWASKVVGAWVATSAGPAGPPRSAGPAADVVAVDPWWRWADPDRVVATVHRADPGAWLAGALEGLGGASCGTGPAGGEDAWLGRWQAAEAAAQQALDESLGGELTEPSVARHLYRLVGEGTTVVVSSSMPVRDLEWYAPRAARPPRVLANRGANGIDGVCSTALGVAAAGGGPVVGVVGDLAFLHDVSSLVAPRPAGDAGGDTDGGAGGDARPGPSPCVLLVVDNGGGGIFDFLPQAGALDRPRFERLFGTPVTQDVVRVATGFGCDVADVADRDGMTSALGAALGSATKCGLPAVVRVRVPDRRANVAVHDRVHRAVAVAATAALGLAPPA
ncbi:MAG: hypothetical protein ACRDYZ_16820, partial [Acidimicrobiales bacterium]